MKIPEPEGTGIGVVIDYLIDCKQSPHFGACKNVNPNLSHHEG